MSVPRFYVELIPSSGPVQLSREDSRHAQSVLRLRAGDNIELFDGSGGLARAIISQSNRNSLAVEVIQWHAPQPQSDYRLDLLMALPKGERQKTLIDQLVQLGVDSLTPIESQRSVAEATPNALERLQRTVIESCKQCGRNRLMQINPPTSLQKVCSASRPTSDQQFPAQRELSSRPQGCTEVCQVTATFIQDAAAVDTACPEASMQIRRRCVPFRAFAHPYGDAQPLLSWMISEQQLRWLQILVGPEGGFTDQECQQLCQSGWTQITLGKSILRVETAAAMIAATWNAWQSHCTYSP